MNKVDRRTICKTLIAVYALVCLGIAGESTQYPLASWKDGEHKRAIAAVLEGDAMAIAAMGERDPVQPGMIAHGSIESACSKPPDQTIGGPNGWLVVDMKRDWKVIFSNHQ